MRWTFWLMVIALASTGMAARGCATDEEVIPSEGAVAEAASQADDERSGVGPDGRAPLRQPWWRDADVVAEIGLSDDQLASVELLMADGADVRSTIRRRERRAGLSFLRALSQDPYDPDQVERRADEVVDTLSDVYRHRLDQVRDLREILTHEQWLRLWKVAPQAVQVTRFRATLGPTISISGDGQPDPGDDLPGDAPWDDGQSP